MALDSDLIPNSNSIGALGALGASSGDSADENNVIDLFQLKSQIPELESDQRLQDLYGTAAMPVFNWVRAIQSGQRTYNPADQFDQQKAEEYRQLQETNPELPKVPGISDMVKGLAPQLGGMIAGGIAEAAFDPVVQGMAGNPVGNVLSEYGKSIFPEALGGGTLPGQAVKDATSTFLSSNAKGIPGIQAALGPSNVFVPELANSTMAARTGNTALFNSINAPGSGVASKQLGNNLVYNAAALDAAKDQAISSGISSNIASNSSVTAATASSVDTSYLGGVSDTLADPGMWASAGVSALFSFGIGVAMGQDPVDAAKSAGASAIGAVIGTTFGGPIGGFIGSAVGGMIGGRVICNELQRQGLMTRKQVVLDYKFTRDHLSPTHVNGYHHWALHVVRQLRQGKNVKLWKHIAIHRVNEIAYIYGERDEPDYLGKIYRHIGEPICWAIGKLKNKESDWSVLYQPKEI